MAQRAALKFVILLKRVGPDSDPDAEGKGGGKFQVPSYRFQVGFEFGTQELTKEG